MAPLLSSWELIAKMWLLEHGKASKHPAEHNTMGRLALAPLSDVVIAPHGLGSFPFWLRIAKTTLLLQRGQHSRSVISHSHQQSLSFKMCLLCCGLSAPSVPPVLHPHTTVYTFVTRGLEDGRKYICIKYISIYL